MAIKKKIVTEKKVVSITPSLAIKLVVKAAVRNDQIGIMFIGESGIGKSALVRQAHEEFNRILSKTGEEAGLIIIPGEGLEATDLTGIPMAGDDGKIKYAPVDILEPGITHKRGIVFCDEMTRWPLDVRQVFNRAVLEGKLGPVDLSGWLFVVAANVGNKYQVEDLDLALANRFRPYEVVADRVEFMEFLKKKDYNDLALEIMDLWVRDVWEVVERGDMINDFTSLNPRGIEFATLILSDAIEKKDMSLLMYDLQALVGVQATQVLMELLHEKQQKLKRRKIDVSPLFEGKDLGCLDTKRFDKKEK